MSPTLWHRMKKREDYDIDLYLDCWTKFYDVEGEPAPITTTSPSPSTKTPVRSTSVSVPFPNATAYAIGGSAVFVLLMCMMFIVCMVMSRKTRSERRRRKAVETEYNVMKTTLTSITDTEDGTTYAEVSMSDPTYRDGHIELPSRKRTRLGGVSNGLTQTVKRFFSVEGNQPTSAEPYAANREPYRREPLPAIPEACQKSNSFPRAREQNEKRLSYRNPEYEEIGPEFLRRSNVYNPLDNSLRIPNGGNGPYEVLRMNTLTPISGSTRSLPKGATGDDHYFIVEKENNDYAKPVKDKDPSDGAYFIVEKDTSGASASNVPTSPDSDLPSSPQSAGVEDTELTPLTLGATSPECVSPERENGGPNADQENNYFLLENSKGNAPVESDYIKPMKQQRNSYIDVLSEHDNFIDIKMQSDERKHRLTDT